MRGERAIWNSMEVACFLFFCFEKKVCGGVHFLLRFSQIATLEGFYRKRNPSSLAPSPKSSRQLDRDETSMLGSVLGAVS